MLLERVYDRQGKLTEKIYNVIPILSICTASHELTHWLKKNWPIKLDAKTGNSSNSFRLINGLHRINCLPSQCCFRLSSIAIFMVTALLNLTTACFHLLPSTSRHKPSHSTSHTFRPLFNVGFQYFHICTHLFKLTSFLHSCFLLSIT